MSSTESTLYPSSGSATWLLDWSRRIRPRRAIVATVIVTLTIFPGQLGEITRALLIDAYLQVSVFVAAALLLFYGSERIFNFRISSVLKNSKYFQVPLSALLGATPGCGGAVVVVAAFASGHASFGAVVAALTATMGDAAFLLIAVRPDAAAVILPLAFLTGILSGWLIDRLRPEISSFRRKTVFISTPLVGTTRWRDAVYGVIAVPGFAFGIVQLTQTQILEGLDAFAGWLALTGVATGLLIWVTSQNQAMTAPEEEPLTRMAEETSFITVWVLAAFLGYEYLTVYGGMDMEAAFTLAAPYLPLIAILIGFIPGCGPQIVVTSLYINGAIPFSALLGNAISNDGDALFPALAIEPRAAVLATAYSAIPALIVAYGFHFLLPEFMN